MNGRWVDDDTIPDEEGLYRRISCRWYVEKREGMRVSSGAFKTERLSVDLSSLTIPEQTFSRAEEPTVGVVSFAAGLARREGKVIVRKPECGNPAHAIAYGCISSRGARRLRNASEWVFGPVHGDESGGAQC